MKDKNIRVSLEIIRYKRGEEHTSKYEYTVTFGSETRMSEVVGFMNDMTALWRKAIAAAKDWENTSVINMDISQYVFDSDKSECEHYDRWYLRNKEDITTDKDEAGIYLCPDTRYTSENRDMFIGRNVLHDMAEYMG